MVTTTFTASSFSQLNTAIEVLILPVVPRAARKPGLALFHRCAAVPGDELPRFNPEQQA